MKPETIRDYINDKTPAIFDCRTAKRAGWALIAFAAGYFISSFLWHIFL